MVKIDFTEMLATQRTLRYKPPISLFYVAILLISFTFSLTFFEYTNFLYFRENSNQEGQSSFNRILNKFSAKQSSNSTLKSEENIIDDNKAKTNEKNVDEKQDENDAIKKEDQSTLKESDKEEDSTKFIKQEEDNKESNNSSEIIFKDGRTFEHLYTKNLNSPYYSKEFPKLEADAEKMEAVKEAFLHAWSNYDQYCFGHDTFHPKSMRCSDDSLHGGLTLIDSISTIIVMGLEEPYKKVRDFVDKKFAPKGSWSLFEFNIRYLGGLLSAYSLSHDKTFKKAAVGLGNAINEVMESTGGFFSSKFHLSVRDRDNQEYSAKATQSSSSYILAEAGTYQLEFFKLAEITGDEKFVNSAISVYKRLWKKNSHNGLITSHIGAGTDSYYEYIIKSYLMTGGVVKEMLNRHSLMMKDIKSSLVFKSDNQDIVGIGTKGGKSGPYAEVEHLATFAAGMIALGSVKENENHEEDLKLASDLATTYAKTYAHFKSGIMPEHVGYNVNNEDKDNQIKMVVDGYILRPETVESIFYLYRFTGDEKYRNYNWQIFKAINSSCRVDHGFTSISRLDLPPEKVDHKDEMESFFLAETLKYLYLTFTDSTLISPAEWVFNTEAHPLHMWDEDTIKKFSDDIETQLTKALRREKIRNVHRKRKTEKDDQEINDIHDNADDNNRNKEEEDKHKDKEENNKNIKDDEDRKLKDDDDRKFKDDEDDRKRNDRFSDRTKRSKKTERKRRLKHLGSKLNKNNDEKD